MNYPHVAFSADHNYIMPTSVAILSLLECSRDCKPCIYLLHDDSVTKEDFAMLAALVAPYDTSLHYLNVGNRFENAHEDHGVTKATYYRLLLPELLPDLSKVIYCDGDILFQCSVSELWGYELSDNLVAGVHRQNYTLPEYAKYISSIGLDPSTYINAGILILNLDGLRKDNIESKMSNFAQSKYKYQDQDLINITFQGRIFYLPERFNAPPYKSLGSNMLHGIVHYCGVKPWKQYNHTAFEWWMYYRKTPFYDADYEYRYSLSLLNPEYTSVELIKMLLRKLLRPLIRQLKLWIGK